MGQKVNPHGIRVGVIKEWDSKWYAEADFADNLVEDNKIRTYLKKITKSESTLRRSYIAQVFLRLKSKEHLTDVRLSFTQLSLVLLSVRAVLKSIS